MSCGRQGFCRPFGSVGTDAPKGGHRVLFCVFSVAWSRQVRYSGKMRCSTKDCGRRLAAWVFLAILLALVGACSPRDGEKGTVDGEGGQDVAGLSGNPAASRPAGCRGCHPLEIDTAHDFACTRCHGGVGGVADGERAHQGLDPRPAAPQTMAAVCGPCHEEEVSAIRQASHYTLAGEINRVRAVFGLEPVAGVPALPAPQGTGLAEVGMDMLRRRCLRCHLWSGGDGYRETRHGVGCAACHLAFGNGGMESHRFQRPDDTFCLHCHYGNFVGADYHGRFERDYNLEYRTPLQPDGYSRRDYGVEYHWLRPDVHARAGLGCLDCHEGTAIMGKAPSHTPSCRGCHDAGATPPPAVEQGPAGRTLRLRSGGRLRVPLMADVAHRRYGNRVACAVCHAQWGFADQELHLLRLDRLDFAPWEDLSVQGSAEVEYQIDSVLYGDADTEFPWMSDGLTGEAGLGFWLLGYRQRRWEEPARCRDEHGVLQVCRSLLDLRLSWVDRDGEVRFDSVAPPAASRLVPYTPHTIGKAGAFFFLRLDETP